MKAFRGALIAIICMISLPGFSQEVEMADNFRNEGKIYVVVAIVLTILAGLFIYLFGLDRKISRLEKRSGGKSSN